jgi:uncharacterized protein (TIGR01777 family)
VRIGITGSTGLVGAALTHHLEKAGHEVIRLIRGRTPTDPLEVLWDLEKGAVGAAALSGSDAVIHLAGENLAAGRWTPARKARIRTSRVQGTRALTDSLVRLEQPPRVLLFASAIGIYGNRGDEMLTEASPLGRGFLADVCQEWEAAAQSGRDHGLRVVHLRLGVVLSEDGGALAKMLPLFRLGLGGPLGDGCQFWSWIGLADVVQAVQHLLTAEALSGAVNLTAPQPVTSREFSRTLGEVLGRPAWLPTPAWLLRLAAGQMADEALLASARVLPSKLLATGYIFQDASLRSALSALKKGRSLSRSNAPR